MIKDADEILQKIREDFLEESLELKVKIQRNLSRIQELDVFLNSGKENQESDFDIFSPRRKEIYSDKVAGYKNEKESIEKENQSLYSQINKLDKNLSALQEVSSAEDSEHKDKTGNLINLDIQEKERQRIARDLHDYSLQNLTHLIHVLELCSLFIDQDPVRAKLELATAGKQIKDIIEDIRNIIFDLRPMEFDDLGFKDALQSLVDKLKNESNIFIELDMEKDIPIVNELIFSNIYRVIKECVINSIKHSETKEIKISVYKKENICYVEIKDNGKGFDYLSIKERKRHFGLQIIEEIIQLMKGSLNIKSIDKFSNCGGSGTIVNITIPING